MVNKKKYVSSEIDKHSLNITKSIFVLILFLFIILLVFTSIDCSAEILINEVMYNPKTDDNYNEWIELFNPTNLSINVNDWIIEDNSAEDSIYGDFENGNGTTIIPPNGYAIIADIGTRIYENFSINPKVISLIVDDLSIGNGLGNSKDKLILKNKSGIIKDAIEWGYDYSDVPGIPTNLIEEGSSLSRYQNIDTNNSISDFFEGINPTPGNKNIIFHNPKLEIYLYPSFIPKIQKNSDYSLPFAIKVNMSYYSSYENYKLKTFIVGDYYSNWPASQTWNGNSWEYSNYYTSTVTTDKYGNWSGWQYVRFNNNYQEYEKNIKEKNSAYLKLKITDENITDEISKKVNLLDMDNSTLNGTLGGCVVGIAQKNNIFLESKIAIIENISGIITGIYITENNEINEKISSIPGYFKLTSPVDSNYIIKFLNSDDNIIHIIENITIRPGKFGVDIESDKKNYQVRKNEILDVKLCLKNTGDFNDSINLNIENILEGWSATLDKERVTLSPKEKIEVNLHIRPYDVYGLISGTINISATSENDFGETDEIILFLEVFAPDLIIKNIKLYNEIGKECYVYGQGEIVKIKAFYRNVGNENATDTKVKFYFDNVKDENFIGCKSYESIGKYQKYPQIKWDTKDISPGIHKIIVSADIDGIIDELNELNNEISINIEILDTRPNNTGLSILITKIYYHSRPGLFNEFICITNPTEFDFNISNWYLTNEPFKIKTEQKKIIFPTGTIIPANSELILSENASSYKWETGKNPDFEYNYDSNKTVPQMNNSKKFIMSNKGDDVSLKDTYNHTIDFVSYGQNYYKTNFWKGKSIFFSGEGVVLVRNLNKKNIPIDTNTSFDWINSRRYGIGQSDFPNVNFSNHCEIITFSSPDCSYQTILKEIQSANESIYLNIYEFTSPFLCDELIKALLRNVSVNIFLEGSPIGGISNEEKYILNRIANYGGDIRFIVSYPNNDVYSRYIFNHGKYLIIDNETVIIESCNWANTGVPKNPTYGNREWGVIVRDNITAQFFLKVFLVDWDLNRCDIYSFDEMNLSVSPYFFMDESVYWGYYKPQFESQRFFGNFSITPVLSPDTSNNSICELIDSSNESIYIEQLYIYKDWQSGINPFVERLIKKAKMGVEVKVILNYNPNYEDTNEKINITKQILEENGIDVKLIYTNWSYFTNVHNKGLIVDNKSVLISSINWNENSVMRNREVGIIIKNSDIANYYKKIFFHDWNLTAPKTQKQRKETIQSDYKNTIYIITIYTLTFALIARDWRKRQWT
ncbi:MAG: hypothetical protein AYK22_06325 [Thermoplasmatales archaeon SG8-52-3]|nr:MAG: hypothetical protein AYK22_06325 [Thermoplasmatales archaeon SG8-52-3]